MSNCRDAGPGLPLHRRQRVEFIQTWHPWTRKIARIRELAPASAETPRDQPLRRWLGFLLPLTQRVAEAARVLLRGTTHAPKAARQPVRVLPDFDDQLLNSPLHRELMRRIEHIESIALDRATRVKDGDDGTVGRRAGAGRCASSRSSATPWRRSRRSWRCPRASIP